LWWIQVLLIGWAVQRCLPGLLDGDAENLWRKFGQHARQREEQFRPGYGVLRKS
jgi:hypothetical protein